MLTHVEGLVEDFMEWHETSRQGDATWELPEDGNLALTIAIWIQDRGARKAGTHEALLRAVVLLLAEAANGKLSLETISIPRGAAPWWMLEHTEFVAARLEPRQASPSRDG